VKTPVFACSGSRAALFEQRDERTCPFQCPVEIVDAEEQEEAVARWRLVWAHQGGMLVRAPLVEADQDGSVRIQDLTKVVMGLEASWADRRATGTI
jgi:hypothetical protein